jgi:hypothetical protein
VSRLIESAVLSKAIRWCGFRIIYLANLFTPEQEETKLYRMLMDQIKHNNELSPLDDSQIALLLGRNVAFTPGTLNESLIEEACLRLRRANGGANWGDQLEAKQ